MPKPTMQDAIERLRQALTWCKQWRDTHPKWFRAGIVACMLVGLYLSGWLLSLVRAVLWLIITLAIGTAGLLWASQRWAWISVMLDGRRWLLTRRPHVALVAAGMTSVALWSLNTTVITTQIDHTFPKVLVRIIFAKSLVGARTQETTCVVVIDRSWVTKLLNENARSKRRQIPWMLEVASSLPESISDLDATPNHVDEIDFPAFGGRWVRDETDRVT